jgi:lipopolysaccharide transport system permease protein
MELILDAGRSERHYWRDLSVRYKQTCIGVAWAVVRPFLTMVVFTVIFGKVAKLPAPESTPCALLVFAGMLPWQFFATALGDASNSLIANSNLISKVYFPRLIVPTANVVVAFVDFLVSFAIMIGMMLWYRFLPGWQVLLLPAFVVLAFFASLGPGLWITALKPWRRPPVRSRGQSWAMQSSGT